MKNSFLLLATLNLSLGGLAFLLGLLILRENPRQRLNRVVSLMLFFGGIGSILAALSFLQRPNLAAAGAGIASVQHFAYLWEFFFPTLFLFACIFPTERAFLRRIDAWRPARWVPGVEALIYAPHTFHFLVMIALALIPPARMLPSLDVGKPLEALVGVVGLFANLFLAIHQSLFSIVNLGFGLAAVALLIDSFRRAQAPRLRRQLRAIGLGLAACLLLYGWSDLIPTLFGFAVAGWVRSALTAGALTLGSGAIAYAIVRHKFLDAKLLARRGILYGVASAALVGFYLAVVVQLNRGVTSLTGLDTRVVEPVFLIVALIMFQPAISRLEDILDRVLLRDPTDHRNVLRNLTRELQTTIELDPLLTRSIRTIAEALLLRHAHVVVLPPGGVIVQTGAGDPPAPEDQARLPNVLRELPAGEESVRAGDLKGRIPDADFELLAERLGAWLVIPLHSRGETVGALLLGEKLTGTEYSAEDVALLSTLAAQMSVSLQNALLVRERVQMVRLEEELNLARQIQRSFLMSQFPPMECFDVYGLNIPSKAVGGDFYDLVPCGDDVFLLAIADVAGKGVPAALLTSMLQASLRTQAGVGISVGDILRNINALVYRSTAVHQFATFFVARIEQGTGRMTFSNAGHNYPMVVRRNGERLFLDQGGIVLGIMESASYEEGVVALCAGDLLVLYTDGISEAFNGQDEQFGEERLCDAVRALPHDMSAREMTDQILSTLREFLGEAEPTDDMTLMVVRVLEREPARREPEPATRAVETHSVPA
ncbi:MAG TPA: GAF domain-containing SpoIIE family protein phosphatase [Candidatus Limnocylindria bacterium]|nr:GAF domain-containing SpoIIE family protein phosphatase [Candidatus Limnocylindria bacterium]